MKDLEPFERRIEILKLLQGREMRTGEIAEYFDVDERTIRSDIKALRDGMDILGIKIESKHQGSQKHYYKSTVHPILLALNLSELYALLKLLENAMLKRKGEIYKHIFQQVYS
ncbi:MAG: HTH domain-containing protein [Clostridia bacterium]|nr:HTH domain-containing protein [Clostridia bacterium]